MANIAIAGNALVVKSSMALEDLKRIARFKPEALRLYEDDFVAFEITVGDKPGLNKFGATFRDATFDEEKKAVITMTINPGDQDAKEYVADTYGLAISQLNKVEQVLPGALQEIDETRAEIMNGITVA